MSRSPKIKLSLVIPVFNEAETVCLFVEKINQVFAPHPDISLELLFVNDGSTDNTLDTLLLLQKVDARIKIIDLSRNFGKEAAMTAGLEVSTGDIVVPIDADLQHPPEIILEMIEKWHEGYEVVLGRRTNRDDELWAKRVSAKWFYRLHNKISSPQLPENVGDFRLMDRCVVEALKKMPESQRFMKGLFAWAGFRTTTVDYFCLDRIAGNTKFNGWKLWNFALEGITSFSTMPLRIWTYFGVLISLTSFLYVIFIVLRTLIYGIDIPGYASLIVTITFMGGVQLIGIGILGEYLGRTYIEAKNRPVYIARRFYVKDDN